MVWRGERKNGHFLWKNDGETQKSCHYKLYIIQLKIQYFAIKCAACGQQTEKRKTFLDILHIKYSTYQYKTENSIDILKMKTYTVMDLNLFGGTDAMPDGKETVKIRRARGGDEAALAGLIAGYMPVIRRFARAAACPGLDFEDAVQEGYIGLFYAVNSFCENGQASFSTYAAVCIRNAVLTARRAALRKKHQPLSEAVLLNEQQALPGPEEQMILREQLRETIRGINTKLTGFEKRALLLSLRGRSYAEIASELSKSPKAVDNALVRVRRKLRRAP